MNKVVWITGAGSGIGKALAEAYHRLNYTVILSGRKIEPLNALSELLPGSHVLPLDVTDESAIVDAVKEVETRFDRLDILINNAGISQRGTVRETSNEVGRKIMEVNFFGSIHLTKAALDLLVRTPDSMVMAMSSAAGKFGFPLRSYYSAGKHALQGFYESLSLELSGTDTHVMIVCPGRIKTDISKNALTGTGQAHAQMDDGQLNGIPAERCASIIVRAGKRRKHEVYIGGKEILMVYFKRFTPWLFRFIAKRIKPT